MHEKCIFQAKVYVKCLYRVVFKQEEKFSLPSYAVPSILTSQQTFNV
jgi:hypothetical protein